MPSRNARLQNSCWTDFFPKVPRLLDTGYSSLILATRVLDTADFMTEIERIADQLERGFDGDAWHGDPLLKILEPVNARQAAATPIRNAHSIWEIVNHIRAWRSAVTARLNGQVRELAGPADWPPVADTSETAWRDCIRDLVHRHQAFMEAVRTFPESKLYENAPNRDHSYYVMLHGMVQHDLYHAGQIAILKKAAK